MNSQNQLKEEPLAEYHVKKRKLNEKLNSVFFVTSISLCLMTIFLLVKEIVNPYFWIATFYFILFCCFLVFYLKKSFKSFIINLLFVFSFATLFWLLSYEYYSVGVNEIKTKYEYEMTQLTRNILNSNLPKGQQQEYLKILFSQYNAQVEICQKDLKDNMIHKNIIYQQDFKIGKGVSNYELDTDFKNRFLLNNDSQKYYISYTSYKVKENINPFLSALTFNLFDVQYYAPYKVPFLFKSKKTIENSLCFFFPLFVLLMLLIPLSSEKEK